VIPMGDGFMVFGDVICFHVADDVMVEGRVDASRLQPVGKLDGQNYSTVMSVERLELPVEVARATGDYAGTR
jgi:flavin reductase (DIM6/NTAB) family NADH-FMN oxidoreductase RutF